MENASKALIMAGSMLIGVIIISIGVYIFTSFGNSSKQIQEQIDSRVIAEFNNNFLKYLGSDECTIHDIVSLAYFARKTNEEDEISSNSQYYIHVIADGMDLSDTNRYKENDMINFLSSKSIGENDEGKKDIQYYKVDKITYSDDKKVNGITFKKSKVGQ